MSQLAFVRTYVKFPPEFDNFGLVIRRG